MTDSADALLARARRWSKGDPDPVTRREMDALVQANALAELEERFARPLTFGTAGLRGVVGAGPGRMNRAVVIRATRALAEHLLAHVPDAKTLPVVLGFDARTSSHEFARAAAAVLTAAGIPVRYFPAPVPTPLVVYAARALAASAAVVVTASHNPPEYNGYKLYGPNSVQVVPPMDADIERRILALPPASEIASDSGEWGAPERSTEVPASLVARYLADIDALRPRGDADRSLRIVYTPMHGVGGDLATRALAAAGFAHVSVVSEQAAPDGTFPTVRFPNPEEPGALDLALRDAAAQNADLVLANDPDADRLAVAATTPSGRFIPLTGNQIGVLLADFCLERTTATRPFVVTTVVSSPMLAELARARGAHCEMTLTGFKWIWTAALELEWTRGLDFVFGYEEAIGFSVGRTVRDKDGISAALVFAELAAQCRARGVTVLERLRALYERYGLWASAPYNVVREGTDGAAEIRRSVDRLVTAPPASLGGVRVENVEDYRSGADKRPPWLPDAAIVVLRLADGGRAIARPSGTEPKLKIYVDLRGEAPREGLWDEQSKLVKRAAGIGEELARGMGL